MLASLGPKWAGSGDWDSRVDFGSADSTFHQEHHLQSHKLSMLVPSDPASPLGIYSDYIITCIYKTYKECPWQLYSKQRLWRDTPTAGN